MNFNEPVSIQKVPLQWQSYDNQEKKNGNSQLSKTILEEKAPTNPSSLDTKKVVDVKAQANTNEKKEIVKGNMIPSIFGFPKVTKVVETLKVGLTQSVTAMKKAPNDILPRALYAGQALCMAEVFKFTEESERELLYTSRAITQINIIRDLNYFHYSTQYATFLLKAYQGINSLDMNSVRDGLLTLKRAQALNPEDKTIAKELESTLKFLEDKWTMMKSQGDMDESTYKLLKEDLKQILREDPFKEEFQKNPALFKSVKNAPEAFLTTHSHLRSINDFLARHPDAGRINLPNGVYNTENLKLCISKAKTDPLARSIYLITSDPLLSPFVANLLKDLMIDCPHISILFGNEHDGDTLVKAFEADKTIISSTESIKRGVGSIESHEGKVYRYFIDPKYPIKKLK